MARVIGVRFRDNGKIYYFSIEDQEEFCENLNKLIENSKNR